MDFVIKTFGGLEEVLAKELKDLGIEKVRIIKRAVTCSGEEKDVYRFNYLLRTAVKVMVPIKSFEIKDKKDLYQKVSKIDWSKYLNANQTFAIDSVMNSDLFDHSNYPSLVTKDAIADQFFDKVYKRPNINRTKPDFKINLHLSGNKVNLSWDTSGDPLFKRGYRLKTNEAPINEVIAAGILKLTDWDPKMGLLDPMCGSGTFLTEAVMSAYNIPAGIMKTDYAFSRAQNFNESLWEEVKKENAPDFSRPIVEVLGRDLSTRTLKTITQVNFKELGITKFVATKRADFLKAEAPSNVQYVIMNPPYDERLAVENVKAFYKSIGDKCKSGYKGAKIVIVSTNVPAMKSIGMKLHKHEVIENVKIEYQVNSYLID